MVLPLVSEGPANRGSDSQFVILCSSGRAAVVVVPESQLQIEVVYQPDIERVVDHRADPTTIGQTREKKCLHMNLAKFEAIGIVNDPDESLCIRIAWPTGDSAEGFPGINGACNPAKIPGVCANPVTTIASAECCS